MKLSQLIVPVKIPDEIADEELADIGIEGGVESGKKILTYNNLRQCLIYPERSKSDGQNCLQR